MTTTWRAGFLAGAVLGLVLGALAAVRWAQPLTAAEPPGTKNAGVQYSVVETQGHNLLVTDNRSNTLYFYTVDRDKHVGSELKLRGSIDLTQVGKPVLKPQTHKHD
jgi:hypothetical protein